MYVVDVIFLGVDGVKFVDVNDDGRFDVVIGWEEGGLIRFYF